MGTLVTIDVVGGSHAAAIDRAFAWFHHVEATCSRFDAGSELMRLCARAGEAVRVSPLLFEALRFAVAVAAETGGAFDPTVGGAMAARGFDREHRSGARVSGPDCDPRASHHDVRGDARGGTGMLARPLPLAPAPTGSDSSSSSSGCAACAACRLMPSSARRDNF